MPEKLTRRGLIAIAAAVALPAIPFLIWRLHLLGPEKMLSGKFPEQIVYVRSNDDIVDAGAIFTPPKDTAKPIAIIWIHGWGMNFYQPTYVAIGRALAEYDYTTIVANTRMHVMGRDSASPQ